MGVADYSHLAGSLSLSLGKMPGEELAQGSAVVPRLCGQHRSARSSVLR